MGWARSSVGPNVGFCCRGWTRQRPRADVITRTARRGIFSRYLASVTRPSGGRRRDHTLADFAPAFSGPRRRRSRVQLGQRTNVGISWDIGISFAADTRSFDELDFAFCGRCCGNGDLSRDASDTATRRSRRNHAGHKPFEPGQSANLVSFRLCPGHLLDRRNAADQAGNDEQCSARRGGPRPPRRCDHPCPRNPAGAASAGPTRPARLYRRCQGHGQTVMAGIRARAIRASGSAVRQYFSKDIF